MTLIVKPGFNGMTDADAIAYVNAVEAADGQLLEFGVGKAINDFVVGCKLDGTWSAIKASCILAGARTLAGALVPLVGTAPTNNNFVSGDYNRLTGLKGDGSSKYLDSNQTQASYPQNSHHYSIYIAENNTGDARQMFLGTGSATATTSAFTVDAASGNIYFRNRANSSSTRTLSLGFFGTNRSEPATYISRNGGSNASHSVTSVTPTATNIRIFGISGYADGRLSFYSLGESLDLAKLDTRVSALITAFGAAIP
jgi:hypothetical protein